MFTKWWTQNKSYKRIC